MNQFIIKLILPISLIIATGYCILIWNSSVKNKNIIDSRFQFDKSIFDHKLFTYRDNMEYILHQSYSSLLTYIKKYSSQGMKNDNIAEYTNKSVMQLIQNKEMQSALYNAYDAVSFIFPFVLEIQRQYKYKKVIKNIRYMFYIYDPSDIRAIFADNVSIVNLEYQKYSLNQTQEDSHSHASMFIKHHGDNILKDTRDNDLHASKWNLTLTKRLHVPSSAITIATYVPTSQFINQIQKNKHIPTNAVYNDSYHIKGYDNNANKYYNNMPVIMNIGNNLQIYALYDINRSWDILRIPVLLLIISLVSLICIKYRQYTTKYIKKNISRIYNACSKLSLINKISFHDMCPPQNYQSLEEIYDNEVSNRLHDIPIGISNYINSNILIDESNNNLENKQSAYISNIINDIAQLFEDNPDEYESFHNAFRSLLQGKNDANTGSKIGYSYLALRMVSQKAIQFSNTLKNTISELRMAMKAKEQLSNLKQELNIAQKIQGALLPADMSNSRIDIHGKVIAADFVAGDFYDFFMIDENTACVIIADVSGKGIVASIFNTLCKNTIRYVAKSISVHDPGHLLTLANNEIIDQNSEELFITMTCCIIDIKNKTMKYTTAGHFPPIIMRDTDKAGCQAVSLEANPDPIIGIFPDINYSVRNIDLQSNTKLFMYSDGVTEAQGLNGNEYGEDRLYDILSKNAHKNSETIFEDVYIDLSQFVQMENIDEMHICKDNVDNDHDEEHKNFDDISMIIINVK